MKLLDMHFSPVPVPPIILQHQLNIIIYSSINWLCQHYKKKCVLTYEYQENKICDKAAK